jgi:hypothetical protein
MSPFSRSDSVGGSGRKRQGDRLANSFLIGGDSKWLCLGMTNLFSYRLEGTVNRDHPCISPTQYTSSARHPIPPILLHMDNLNNDSESLHCIHQHPCCWRSSCNLAYHHPQLTSHPTMFQGCKSPQFHNCHFNYAGRDCTRSGKLSQLFPCCFQPIFSADTRLFPWGIC